MIIFTSAHLLIAFQSNTVGQQNRPRTITRRGITSPLRTVRCTSKHSTSLHAKGNDFDDLVSSFLNNDQPSSQKDNDPYSQYTHQIAIPLSSSSELTSALHSIQTSLVRDCPRLIRACVMPATLRLPLLYVDASSAAAAASTTTRGNGIFSSTNEIDLTIEQIVQDAIQTSIYNKDPSDLDGIGTVELPEPIMLPFRGLELQGADNSILYAVGCNINDAKKDEDTDEDGVYIIDNWGSSTKTNGYERLEQLVETIQSELEKRGYKTAWPLDEPQGNEIFPGEDETLTALRAKTKKKWRPRVPFVRLPSDFYDDLQPATNNDANSLLGMDEIDEFFSKGYDGISPSFWYEAWAEDDILPSPGVRMRSVQVYRRMMSGGGEAESSYYELPSSSATIVMNNPSEKSSRMDLPAGDAKLMEKEQNERKKEMQRIGEVESEAEREWEQGKARMLATETRGAAGEIIDGAEDDYAEFDVSIETGDVVVDGDSAYSSPWSERNVDTIIVAEEDAAQVPDAETKVTNAELKNSTIIAANNSSTRELPNIEDNPIFQRLWKGESQVNAQGESTAQSLDGTPATMEETLPPYPSDEHFIGIWKVVQSPLGVALVDESSQSDNLVLRVDGQVMGGPILDSQYKHKAAGGSWKMFQAVRKFDDDDESDQSVITQTRLRIKLLVPPQKNQIIVMEGEVTRVSFGGKTPTSLSAFSGTGGMLDGMSTAKLLEDDEMADSNTGEQVLYCGGEAWMENVDGSGRRRKLGPFSLTKQKTVDRNQLIYTVPASRGIPDTTEDQVD